MVTTAKRPQNSIRPSNRTALSLSLAPGDRDAKAATTNLAASLNKHIKPAQRQKAIDAAINLLRSRAGSGLSKAVERDLHIELGAAVEKNLPWGQELFPTKAKAKRLCVELEADGLGVKEAAVGETIKYMKSGPIQWGTGLNKQGKASLDKPSVDSLLISLGHAQSYLKAAEAESP